MEPKAYWDQGKWDLCHWDDIAVHGETKGRKLRPYRPLLQPIVDLLKHRIEQRRQHVIA